MKIYDLEDEEGRAFAFEVDATIGRRGAERVVAGIPGVRMIRRRRALSGEDAFCAFELDGVAFVIEEPWGDNGRYWIGSSPARWTPQLESVRAAFRGRRGVHPALRVALVVSFGVLVAALLLGVQKPASWPRPPQRRSTTSSRG